MSQPPAPALEDALLATFAIRSTRERLRQLVQRGFTAVQVYERLPQPLREELAGDEQHPTLAARKAKERVHAALTELVAAGKLERRREAYGMILNTKGGRGMIVDVYRRP